MTAMSQGDGGLDARNKKGLMRATRTVGCAATRTVGYAATRTGNGAATRADNKKENLMKVYTKTGDKGQTSLVGGQRVSKCCERLESYGTVDELNSHIGVLITYCTDDNDSRFLTAIQAALFVVGGYLATDNASRDVRPGNIVTPEMVEEVEKEIDKLQAMLPPLRLFILPGGSRAASYAHVCRTVCRRAERMILRLAECGAEMDDNVLAYINRLSDYFFVLARKLNVDHGVEDIVWRRQGKEQG